MRIRKHFSRLFESVAVLPSSHPPPPALGCSSPSLPPSHASTRLQTYVCQLNCSPWDVMPFPSNYDHLNCQQEEESKERGILGNEVGGEEPTSLTTSTPALLKCESDIKKEEEREIKMGEKTDKEDKKKKRKKDRKEMKIETSAEATSTISTSCKKSDGKGWKCKRAAHHPHTLCHYHLTQLRSNSYNQNHNKVPADHGKAVVARGSKNHRNTIAEAVAGAVGTNLNYYYYSGFGPRWSKRREGADAGVSAAAEEEEGGGGKEHLEYDDDGQNAAMVHDDQGDDGNDREGRDVNNGGDNDNSVDEPSDGEYKRKKRDKRNSKLSRRKRGRKPMKARSLKSLL